MNINLLQREGFALVSSWKFTLGCLLLMFCLNCLYVVAYSEYASFILCILTFRSLHHRKGLVVLKNNMFAVLAMSAYLFYLSINSYASVNSRADFEEVYDDLSKANFAAVHLSGEGFGVYDESTSSYALMRISNMIEKMDVDGYVSNSDAEAYGQIQRKLISEIMQVKMMVSQFYESQSSHVQTFVHYYQREEEKSIFSIDNTILMKTNISSDIGVMYMLDKYFEEVRPIVKVRRSNYNFENPHMIVDSTGAKVLLVVSIILLFIFIFAVNFYRKRSFDRNYILGNNS